ncbi:hypothetical protein PQR75_46700 [Paraburkholderia fungorum]|uniref:hypothetical protein n=1 Tax=Paraburkholderia fungorum TaxID=134537 RepID=UPI0038BCE5FC
MSERANPLEGLNLADEFPVKSKKTPRLPPETIEKIAQDNGFPSRQPALPKPAEPARKQRRYTTGRNVQIPVKGTAETKALLEALADELQEPYGEVIARALAALRRELDGTR